MQAQRCCSLHSLQQLLRPAHSSQHLPTDPLLQYCPAGSCGITQGTVYNVYLVAQDFVFPPNLQTAPSLRVLNSSSASSAFTCSPSTFTQQLRPTLTTTSSSPGLPVGQFYSDGTGDK